MAFPSRLSFGTTASSTPSRAPLSSSGGGLFAFSTSTRSPLSNINLNTAESAPSDASTNQLSATLGNKQGVSTSLGGGHMLYIDEPGGQESPEGSLPGGTPSSIVSGGSSSSGDSSPFTQGVNLGTHYLPVAVGHQAQQLVSADLLGRIVKDYGLGHRSEIQIQNYLKVASLYVKMTPEAAFNTVITLAAQLEATELLRRSQSLQIPSVDQLNAWFEKLDSKLVGTTVLTSIQIENIRALTNTMAFDEERYEFTRMTEDVMAELEQKKTSYGLQDAFKTPAGIKILRAKVSELVSSITGQLRELVLESLRRKHKFWSLFLFTHKACKKFCGKSTEPTRGMLFKCVIIRRFVEDHPVVMPTDMSTHLAKKRKANNSGSENGDVAKATTTPYMVTMNRDEGTMKSHTGETVPFPPIPPKANFRAMFEWHFAILKLALGQTNSEAWKKYLMDIIEEDRSNYPHSSSSGVDDIDALLNAPAPEPAVQWTPDTMVNFEGRDLYTPGTVPQ